MDWKKPIASFLFVLLIFFSCNNLPYVESATYGDGGPVSYSLRANSLLLAARGLSFSKIVVKTDHIKVRFMGSGCSFEAAGLGFMPALPVFIIKSISIRARNFIYSYSPFRFDLRGPPTLS